VVIFSSPLGECWDVISKISTKSPSKAYSTLTKIFPSQSHLKTSILYFLKM